MVRTFPRSTEDLDQRFPGGRAAWQTCLPRRARLHWLPRRSLRGVPPYGSLPLSTSFLPGEAKEGLSGVHPAGADKADAEGSGGHLRNIAAGVEVRVFSTEVDSGMGCCFKVGGTRAGKKASARVFLPLCFSQPGWKMSGSVGNLYVVRLPQAKQALGVAVRSRFVSTLQAVLEKASEQKSQQSGGEAPKEPKPSNPYSNPPFLGRRKNKGLRKKSKESLN